MFANNLREYRIRKNLNQRELAELLGVSKGAISSWEMGRTEPNMGMVENIARVLEVSKSDLMGEALPVDYMIINGTEKIFIEMVRKLSDDKKADLFMRAYKYLDLKEGE